jgi:LCP family protein required for cell wall assembly
VSATATPPPPTADPPAPPPRPPRPPHAGAAYYRVPPRRRRWPAVALWALWLSVGVAVAVAVSSYLLLDETLRKANPDTAVGRAAAAATDPVLPGQPVTLLLIGSDKRAGREGRGDAGRSDSLILVRMDSRRGFISMLSFPRDLYVAILGHGTDKINAAYSVGGPARTIETVRALTGQRINYYLNVDFQGFARLVNQVGGVYVDVDRRYFNDNSTPGPEGSYAAIDLKPGYQRLDGDDALAYVRYRHTDSDFARIARQQQFLSELKRQTGRFSNLLDLSTFAHLFSDNVETNLSSVRRLLSLAELAFTTDKDRVARVAISGRETMRGGASVVIAGPGEIRAKVAEWRTPAFEAGAPARAVDPATVSIGVLNGNGRLLGADAAVQALRARRYDAHSDGNADNFRYGASAVYYAPGQRDAAKAVQALLGSGTSIAAATRRQTGGRDLTVVAGRSFRLGGGGQSQTARAGATGPNVVWTDGLATVLAPVQRYTGLRVMVPRRLPPDTRLRIRRTYRVNTGGTGPWAVKLVFETGYHAYWGIEETAMKDPPILEGRTGVIRRNGREYRTYYDGRHLQRLAWQEGGMTYWISNTLDERLSADTMHAIARSARPLASARLPRGQTSAELPVELDGSTP